MIVLISDLLGAPARKIDQDVGSASRRACPERTANSTRKLDRQRSVAIHDSPLARGFTFFIAKVIIGDEAKTAKPAPVTAADHRDVAADLMSEIQVETYSSMDSREKTEL